MVIDCIYKHKWLSAERYDKHAIHMRKEKRTYDSKPSDKSNRSNRG